MIIVLKDISKRNRRGKVLMIGKESGNIEEMRRGWERYVHKARGGSKA